MRRILVLMRHGSQPKFLVPAHMEVFGDNRVEHKRRPISIVLWVKLKWEKEQVGRGEGRKRLEGASWVRGAE